MAERPVVTSEQVGNTYKRLALGDALRRERAAAHLAGEGSTYVSPGNTKEVQGQTGAEHDAEARIFKQGGEVLRIIRAVLDQQIKG